MKKLLVIVTVVFLAGGLYFLFFARISERCYNGIICYYVSHRVVRNAKTFEEKVAALQHFVHENMHPIGTPDKGLGNVSAETLVYGIGWCDQQARAVVQLAHQLGIKSRVLFLQLDGKTSPHSTAEALSPDQRWVIVCPLYNLHLVNKNGKLASRADIINDPSIIYNNEKVRLRSTCDSNLAVAQFVKMFCNAPEYVMTKKGIRFDILRPFPIAWIRPIVNIIQNRYFKQLTHNIDDIYKIKFMQARGYQLLGYYDKSKILYLEIINNSATALLRYKAQYFYSLLLEENERLQEAESFINEVVGSDQKNQFTPYLLGTIKVQILDKTGRHQEAGEILRQLGYPLEV